MTPLQNLEIRATEIRSRLGDIGGMEEMTDEVRSELTGLKREYQDNENRQTALKMAGDSPRTPLETRTGEGRDFRELITRSNVGEIFDAAVNHRAVDGATAEIQKHYGLDANAIPLSLLVRSWPDADELETRAITPAPGNVGSEQMSIIPYVFPQSAATFLGVGMPTVSVGEQVFPVLTSKLVVGTPTEGNEQVETTGAFSADVLSPSRIQASFEYSREDRARFAGMDAALRENLSMGLADGLDYQVLRGTNGLFTGTVLANHNVTDATTYALYRSQLLYSRIDGRYAAVAGDIRVLMGADTYAHAAAQYRGNNDNQDALQAIMDASAGVRVSAHVPDTASSKQNAVVRLGSYTDMVAPIWEGVTLIPDDVTKAKSGQIVVTAVMLHAVKLLRTDGFYKQQTQHA